MTSTVLVADDSAKMREMIIKQFRSLGYVVAGQAKNGAEAVEMYKNLKPDIVTLDIGMPELDGIGAAKEILSVNKSARVFFLYNFPDEDLLEEAEKIGVLGFASKHRVNQLFHIL
ncbi:MAG: response regulator [Candidatus Electronema sp. V4]|uniref:response regulator n=1 Tax=Candidatus Electronema sp. V4 TaxID=3454756 RepID=UPI00405599BA